MFNLKITTNTERRPAISVMFTQTVAEVLDQNNVSTQGATVNLNGRTLGAADFGRTFAEFEIPTNKESILSVVVKADSAA